MSKTYAVDYVALLHLAPVCSSDRLGAGANLLLLLLRAHQVQLVVVVGLFVDVENVIRVVDAKSASFFFKNFGTKFKTISQRDLLANLVAHIEQVQCVEQLAVSPGARVAQSF